MKVSKLTIVFLAAWTVAACTTTTQQGGTLPKPPEAKSEESMEAKTNSTASIAAKVVRAEKSAPVFSSKQIEEDAKEFAKNLSQNYLGKHYTPLGQNKIKLVMKRNPKDSLKEYQKRFVRNFSGALNKWVREFLPPDNYGEFFLALNDDLSDRKFYNREDVRYIAEDPLTSLKYSGFIVVEFLDGEMGDELTKEFAVSFLPLDYERARLPSMIFSKLRIPEFMQKDVPCRKGSFCDPFVVGKDNPANIGDYYTDHFCSTFKFSSPTKGYVLDFKGIRSNTANIFQLLLESRLVCDNNLEIIINDSNLKGIYDWEEAVSILGSLRDEGSSPKPMKPAVLFEGMGIPMGSKVYFTIRMIYWDKEKAGQVARNTAQDIYLIENHSQHGESFGGGAEQNGSSACVSDSSIVRAPGDASISYQCLAHEKMRGCPSTEELKRRAEKEAMSQAHVNLVRAVTEKFYHSEHYGGNKSKREFKSSVKQDAGYYVEAGNDNTVKYCSECGSICKSRSLAQ